MEVLPLCWDLRNLAYEAMCVDIGFTTGLTAKGICYHYSPSESCLDGNGQAGFDAPRTPTHLLFDCLVGRCHAHVSVAEAGVGFKQRSSCVVDANASNAWRMRHMLNKVKSKGRM